MTLRSNLDLACEDPRADCPSEDVKSSGGDAAASGLNMNVVFIVIGVLIVAALLGLMFVRRGRQEVEPKWNEASLPVHDTVANSMYGGAQHIFQQQVAPVAAPAAAPAPAPAVAPPASPVAPVVAHAGPPLPPGGLPAGWTMEQWTYYGQQYIDQMNQR